MKFLNKLFNWIFGTEEETENIIDMHTKPQIIEDEYVDYGDWIDLELQKQKAINKCKGCRDKVFVLKRNGEDIAYASNIRQLAIVSNIPSKSLYRAYNNSKPYKKVYEITKLE